MNDVTSTPWWGFAIHIIVNTISSWTMLYQSRGEAYGDTYIKIGSSVSKDSIMNNATWPGRYQSCGETKVHWMWIPPVVNCCLWMMYVFWLNAVIHQVVPISYHIFIHIRPIILTSSTWSPRFEKSTMTGFGHALSSSQVTEQTRTFIKPGHRTAPCSL